MNGCPKEDCRFNRLERVQYATDTEYMIIGTAESIIPQGPDRSMVFFYFDWYRFIWSFNGAFPFEHCPYCGAKLTLPGKEKKIEKEKEEEEEN